MSRRRDWLLGCLGLASLLSLGGCRQDMHNQPKFIPLRESPFFSDHRSERPLVDGTVARGRERYDIYCAPCHARTGNGDGMVVRRGFRAPPSYHIDRLRQSPVGHFFDVITNGFGAMPDYRQQVPVRARWAINAYIRALQASTTTGLGDVPPERRGDIRQAPK